MQYSYDMSAVLMFFLFLIILWIKLAITLLHADTQGKANSRFLVTAFAVDISQNKPPFSCIMTLARDGVYGPRLIYLERQLFLTPAGKDRNIWISFYV